MTVIKPNFRLADSDKGGSNTYQVKAGTAGSILAGDIVLQNTSGDVEYVKAAGTLVVDTDDIIVGIAATTSDETATADGTVQVYDELDAEFIGKALVSGNLSTATLLTVVTIDSAATGVQTVKENDVTKGIALVNSYTSDGEVKFTFKRSVVLGA